MIVFDMKFLRHKVWVSIWDRIRNKGIRRRAGIDDTLAEKVDKRELRWFRHVERINEGRRPRKVKAAKVEGRQG